MFPIRIWCQEENSDKSSAELYLDFELYKNTEKAFLTEIKTVNERDSNIVDKEIARITIERSDNWNKLLNVLKELAQRNDPNLKKIMMNNIDLHYGSARIHITDDPQFIMLIKYGEDLLAEVIAKERINNEAIIKTRWLFTVAGIVGQKNMKLFCKDFLLERSAQICLRYSDEFKFSNENVEKVYKEFLGKPYKVPNIDYPAFKKRFQKKLDAAMKKAKEEALQPKAEKSKAKEDPARPFVEDRKADENNSPQNSTGNESGSLPWTLGILALLAVAVGIGVARRKQR